MQYGRATGAGRAPRWGRALAVLLALHAVASCSGGSQGGDAGGDAVAEGGEGGGEGCPAPGQMRCNGACVDVSNDPANCGMCGTACAAGPGGTASCRAGACVLRCEPGRADCNGMASDGCEVSLESSVQNCGSCGIACGEAPNGTPTCADAQCGVECTTPFQNCDMYVETGCESDAQSDAEHCGRCGNQCPWPPNSEFTCGRGACEFTCRPGYDNCDRVAPNGCEVSLVSGRNCGACGMACPTGKVCARQAMGTACVDRCPVGTVECDGGCVDTQTDPNHCGMCGTQCPGGVNAAPDCRGGRCALRCRPGYANCDGNDANGCETNLNLSVQHCGACGNTCGMGPNGTAFCAAGQCRLRCAPGTGDCDGIAGNGCETNVSNNPRACGVCNSGCGAGVQCADGQCLGLRCPPNRIDCDGNAANGCEADVRGDVRNCGACGAACIGATNVTAACVNGRCNRTCTANRADCNGMASDGCEVDVTTDVNNCGACGARCGAPTMGSGRAVCNARICEFECERGFHRCGAVCASNTAVESCGNRCDPCPAPENGAASCVSATSTCALQCNPGFLRTDTRCEAFVQRPARLASGRNFACRIRESGALQCFGADAPTGAPTSGMFRQVAASRDHACALAADGMSIVCFGTGEGAVNPPMDVNGPFTQVVCGQRHNCALRADGTVACWGNTTQMRTAVPTGLTMVAQLAAGVNHTCATRVDGTVACWGSNFSGESTPPSGMVAQPLLMLGAGNGNSCGLTSNGTVAAWGNAGGRPVGFAPEGVTSLSCAGDDTCVVLRDGSVRCNGAMGSVVSAVPMSLAMAREVAVGWATGTSPGSTHACALRQDNSVVCWGSVSTPTDAAP